MSDDKPKKRLRRFAFRRSRRVAALRLSAKSFTKILLSSGFFFNSPAWILDFKFWIEKLFQNLKSPKVTKYKHSSLNLT
ncbi:MAG: hypothetical protein V7K48_26590 [Nostoc sp.]|uniref:hypothetical protein n=1 Tax=Nostoc sp. TaxID=1180 RepID=UPI002FFA8FE7